MKDEEVFTFVTQRESLEDKIFNLEELVRHAWVHSAYPDCGLMQMTTPQKILYHQVIRSDLPDWLIKHANENGFEIPEYQIQRPEELD